MAPYGALARCWLPLTNNTHLFAKIRVLARNVGYRLLLA
jgi:hypothetical protein